MFDFNKYRLEANLSLEDIGDYFGKGRSTVHKWEKNPSSIKAEYIPGLARLFKVSPLELLNLNVLGTTSEIPVLGKISAGEPILALQDIIYYQPIVKDLLPSGECFYLKVNGDSMSPTIPDGALVLMRVQDTLENGDIGAILVNDNEEATLKRFKKQSDGIVMLLPDNNDYDPIVVTKDNPCKIMAKAVGFNYTF